MLLNFESFFWKEKVIQGSAQLNSNPILKTLEDEKIRSLGEYLVPNLTLKTLEDEKNRFAREDFT